MPLLRTNQDVPMVTVNQSWFNHAHEFLMSHTVAYSATDAFGDMTQKNYFFPVVGIIF